MNTLDELMETSIFETTPGHIPGAKPRTQQQYDALTANKNLRTYSTGNVLHDCPRKYQIKKLQAALGVAERVNSPTFAFGHAVGAGVAIFDAAQDLRAAIFQAFLAWDIDLLEEEVNKQGKKTGKSFFEAVWALYAYRTFWEEETPLREYEVIKIEATIAVDFEDGHFYAGHIDELLRHRDTGQYLVKENKTTGMRNIDAAMYSNSDQALSYAIVIDMLGGTEYAVLYTVYSSSEQRWVSFSFVKSSVKKAEWIQDQLLINQQLDSYEALNFFPKRGGSCMNFNRRCELYERCDLVSPAVWDGKTYTDLPRILTLEDLNKIETIDYATTLSQIVQRQKEKLHD